MIPYTIYLVDDEAFIRDSIAMAFEDRYRIDTFESAEAGLAAMADNLPDLVLLDIGLPGMDGIRALEEIQKRHPGLLTIMITAFEETDTVIRAMKLGAYDYVVKPLQVEALEVTLGNALETLRLQKEVQVLRQRFLETHLPCFIAESEGIQDVMAFVAQVAKSPDTPVLIQGETGTGKELVASAVHYQSPNCKGPFVAVNCAAIPADLVESELFGYEKGAFSGAATVGKRGMVEAAAGGTLFLDEVGDLSPAAQAKLLRFLEQGEFYRVGGVEKLTVHTRVISATNQDLETMMAEGRFRKDLFFRLGVVAVKIPALNRRREDILPLAHHFLVAFQEKFAKSFSGLSAAAEKILLHHSWTGNVRELKNVMERAVLVGRGSVLTPADLGLIPPAEASRAEAVGDPAASADPAAFAPLPPQGIDLDALQRDLEKYYIEAALKRAAGNESQAARLLGLNHHTFRYRRKKILS